jgi:hypothetical protein
MEYITEGIEDCAMPINNGLQAPTILVGEDVMVWAEQYWHIDKLISRKPEDENAETFSYKYFREIFVKKIDSMVAEKLNPSTGSQNTKKINSL